jgi:hypothetical protein
MRFLTDVCIITTLYFKCQECHKNVNFSVHPLSICFLLWQRKTKKLGPAKMSVSGLTKTLGVY